MTAYSSNFPQDCGGGGGPVGQDSIFYAKKLKTGSTLFLSGFFTTDVDELKLVATEFGIRHVLTKNENEWAMMLLEKN